MELLNPLRNLDLAFISNDLSLVAIPSTFPLEVRTESRYTDIGGKS